MEIKEIRLYTLSAWPPAVKSDIIRALAELDPLPGHQHLTRMEVEAHSGSPDAPPLYTRYVWVSTEAGTLPEKMLASHLVAKLRAMFYKGDDTEGRPFVVIRRAAVVPVLTNASHYPPNIALPQGMFVTYRPGSDPVVYDGDPTPFRRPGGPLLWVSPPAKPLTSTDELLLSPYKPPLPQIQELLPPGWKASNTSIDGVLLEDDADETTQVLLRPSEGNPARWRLTALPMLRCWTRWVEVTSREELADELAMFSAGNRK